MRSDAWLSGAAAVLLMLPAAWAQDRFGEQRRPGQAWQAPAQPLQRPAAPTLPAVPSPGRPDAGAGKPGDAEADRLMRFERQDYGVPPTGQLHAGPAHGPTPASIPGGQLITTRGLVALLQGRQVPYVLVDVLGGPQTLPGAASAPWASQGGSFRDATQQQFARMLEQLTQGRRDVPVILYCQSTQCWMSYNAALRAIALGYTNVLWYRGGIEAWQMAGLPLDAGSRQGFAQQRGGFPQQPMPLPPNRTPN